MGLHPESQVGKMQVFRVDLRQVLGGKFVLRAFRGVKGDQKEAVGSGGNRDP